MSLKLPNAIFLGEGLDTEDSDPDDDLIVTPQDVIMALGFDPAEEAEEEETHTMPAAGMSVAAEED